MTPRKFKLAIAEYSYGGNGGVKSTHPEVNKWISKTVDKAREDGRIEKVVRGEFADTPIPMSRNASIYAAIQGGCDLLLMVDSDMQPDCEPDGLPFWDTSFEFFLKHYDKGPCAICAPYCGPPPNENVYVFEWTRAEGHHPNHCGKIAQYSRTHAAMMTGIQPIAAAPTGVILFDTRIFKLTEPVPCDPLQVLEQFRLGEIGPTQALKLIQQHSWCYYEYTDIYQREKQSTEDVALTRDLSMAGVSAYGYNPIYCNWDAWAGHIKPKVVRKPFTWKVEDIHAQMREAMATGQSRIKRLGYHVDFTPSTNGEVCQT